MNVRIPIAVCVVALAALLTACGGGSAAPVAAPSHSTTPATARPAGCGSVTLAVGTVRGELGNAPDSATFAQASRQLAALGKAVPQGSLRSDVDRANVDLSFYWERITAGETASQQLQALASDLHRLQAECG